MDENVPKSVESVEPVYQRVSTKSVLFLQLIRFNKQVPTFQSSVYFRNKKDQSINNLFSKRNVSV